MESSLLGRNVQHHAATTASRAPTASWSATTPRSRSSMRLLVTGAAGMLGQATWSRAGGAPGHERRGSSTCRSSTSPTRSAVDALDRDRRCGELGSRTRSSTARPGPTSTAPSPTGRARAAVNGDGGRQRRARRRGRRRAARARLDRLRLRRRAGREPLLSSPTRPGRARPTARRSSPASTRCRAAGAPRDRAHLVAVRRRRAELRRDDAAPRRRARRGARRHRPGRLPDVDGRTSRRALVGLAERGVTGIVHVAGAGERARGTTSRVEIFRQAGARRAASTPATTASRSRARRRGRRWSALASASATDGRALPAWRDGPGGVPGRAQRRR